MEEIERALPGLEFGAEENYFFVRSRRRAFAGTSSRSTALAWASHQSLSTVSRVMETRSGGKAERDHHVAAGGGGGKDLAGEAEDGGPDEFFGGEF